MPEKSILNVLSIDSLSMNNEDTQWLLEQISYRDLSLQWAMLSVKGKLPKILHS